MNILIHGRTMKKRRSLLKITIKSNYIYIYKIVHLSFYLVYNILFVYVDLVEESYFVNEGLLGETEADRQKLV